MKRPTSAGSRPIPAAQSVMPAKAEEVIDGFTIKYHANGKTRWSKGRIVSGKAEGYWEWYRLNGTIKRSGHFASGQPVGEWITYDDTGKVYKVTTRKG